jgi:hypothetical protein
LQKSVEILFLISQTPLLTLTKPGELEMNDTLYLVAKFDENNRQRYIGYVIINMAALKVVEAQSMEDIEAYMQDKGYKQYVWRIPKQQKYQMIRVKEW